MKLFGTMKINEQSHLEIGGVDAVDLANEFGTPLYVMDERQIRNQCHLFINNFKSNDVKCEIIYASKAFLTIAMCQLIEVEGLSLDVVSGGELFTALKAKFPQERIYMHGNNKSFDELKMAVENQVGRIIIDNKNELEKLGHVCESLGQKANVMLRVNPGIEAHTHEYISTTKNDSKFGESIFSEEIHDIIKRIDDHEYLNFKGIHSHIGSQIFEQESFFNQLTVMMTFIKTVKQRVKVDIEEINLGGGFGIYYVEGDTPFDLSAYIEILLNKVKELSTNLSIITPKVLIEPGRSIVANAGITLYSVGSTKTTFGGKTYVFVDGSMADNIRTALYDAKYETVVANKMNLEPTELVTVSGKCCESGDMIVKDTKLGLVEAGDLIAVLSTGAYNYSMSSNYNRLTKPAVVFVQDGKARVVVKRETYEDLIRNDVWE